MGDPISVNFCSTTRLRFDVFYALTLCALQIVFTITITTQRRNVGMLNPTTAKKFDFSYQLFEPLMLLLFLTQSHNPWQML